jgi:hypothetical protein
MATLMPRRKGCGGQTYQEPPEKETEANHIESESEPEGGMGDHGEYKVSRLLESMVSELRQLRQLLT